jgi:hypothetical protein
MRRLLRCVPFLEPGHDPGTVDESGPGQRRRIEVRIPRRKVSAVIDELAEDVELPGAGGIVGRCPSGDSRTDATVDHLLDERPPPEARRGAEQSRGDLEADGLEVDEERLVAPDRSLGERIGADGPLPPVQVTQQ